jgi:putative (di)nucleoside polyphosphate hydrolase
MSDDEFFRANVGAVITRSDGRVLALRRADVKAESWQLPQGGMDRGEEPQEALEREIHEETGLGPGDYRIVAESRGWLAYELPAEFRSLKVGRGQVQKWFHCRLIADDRKVSPDGIEFDATTWLTPRELADRVIAFRRPVYEQLIDEFGLEQPTAGPAHD